jgi:hypothetical protein
MRVILIQQIFAFYLCDKEFTVLERYKSRLIALFRKVHELQAEPIKDRLLALEIQEELLLCIGRAERHIRRVRASGKSIKAQLSQRGTERAKALRLKRLYTSGEQRVERQKEFISALRTVGDAIAFIYGDRWDLKQMVLKEDAGFLTGKRGTRLERKILRGAFEMGATVVMNDLTHTLRHGDITVFRPDLSPPGESKFLSIEIKSGRGGNKQRADRQLNAIKRTFDYLNSDKREVESGMWLRVAVREAPKHHFEAATRLARNIPHAGWLVEEVEPGLHYVLIDCACKEYSFSEIFEKHLLGEGRQPLALSVNDAKENHLGYYPFPLCFRDADVLYRFYNGDFVMFVFVDISHVNRLAASHGLSVQLTGDDEYPCEVLPVRTDDTQAGGRFHVGFHPIGRLAAEFLRLDWFAHNIISMPVGDAVRHAASGRPPI